MESNLPAWLVTNAWREIFARVFEGREVQYNITPTWLVNPATNRRLKLDLFYPELNLAIRFEGLRGKKRRRLSLAEQAQQRVRDQARTELCRAQGVQLVVVSIFAEKPQEIFQQLDLALSRSSQQAKETEATAQIKSARTTAAGLARKVKANGDLKLYAELWSDRQYNLAEPAPRDVVEPLPYAKGMKVEHVTFGPGVVVEIAASGDETLLTVDFETVGIKTLAASLVGDKLLPRQDLTLSESD